MSDPIGEVQEIVKDDLLSVEEVIKDVTISDISFIPLVIRYLLESGGKRIRPVLTLIFCKLFGYTGESRIKSAAAIEFIHNATLLHDDVIDDSNIRRKAATAKSIWGNNKSILVGDFLLSMAFKWMVETKNTQILRTVSNASVLIAEGEIRQLLNTENINTSEATYIATIEYKTAVLFSTACEVAAILANQNQQEAILFGKNLGIAYQIVDDILDYEGDETGKPKGNDFHTGKVTLPLIISYRETTERSEKVFWERCINNLNQKEGDFAIAMDYIRKHDATRKSLEIARKHIAVATKQLKIVYGNPEIKQKLANLLDFIAERKF